MATRYLGWLHSRVRPPLDPREINIRGKTSPIMERPRAIHIVYAAWCPHCVPVTVELLTRRAEELGIPCRLYDIDTEAVAEADSLVREHGDWDPDYLVPQVFLEYSNGRIVHVLTGNPRGIALTRKAVEELVSTGPLAFEKGAAPK